MASVPMMLPAQNLKAESGTIDCGQVVFRHPVTIEYKLKNTSHKPVWISDVRTNCGCTAANVKYKTVAGDQTVTIPVTFDAKQLGHFDKKIGIYEKGSKEPVMLTMSGVVVQSISDFAGKYTYTIGSFNADKNEVEFDNVNRGDRPVQKLYIRNNGKDNLQPVVMHLPSWLQAKVSPSTIAPGHSAVINFTLDSRKLRDYGLTLTTVYIGDKSGDHVSEDKQIDVSAVLLPDFDKLTDAQLAKAPRLSLSGNDLDLGAFNGKSKLKGDIEIENKGKSELDIRSLQMFTVGLEVSLNKTKIAPGETAKLKVTANARELKKVKARPRVLMITNDPENPKVIINILTK